MFTDNDLKQLAEKGIDQKNAADQIENFRKGFPFLKITAPATVNNGIIKLDCDEVDDLVDLYKGFDGSRVKFVPDSGAANRKV